MSSLGVDFTMSVFYFRHWTNGNVKQFFFGFSVVARIASVKMVSNPSLVRDEHSRYLMAPIVFFIFFPSFGDTHLLKWLCLRSDFVPANLLLLLYIILIIIVFKNYSNMCTKPPGNNIHIVNNTNYNVIQVVTRYHFKFHLYILNNKQNIIYQ